MPLDDFLPDYDVSEIHSTRIAAGPAAALAAMRALTVREVPLLVALTAIRRLPAVLSRRRPVATRRALDRPLVGELVRAGFVVVYDAPDELVLGVVGRFWTADGGVRRIEPGDFGGFREPGFAKGAVNFHVRAVPGGTLMTTETRVQATDEAARRKFRRYWRLVMPGSALIRRAWLRALRRRAQRR